MKPVKCPKCSSKMKRVYAGNLEIGKQKLVRVNKNKHGQIRTRRFDKNVEGQCYQLIYQCEKKECKQTSVSRGKSYADARCFLNKG